MRRALLLLLVACSSKEQPQDKKTQPPAPQAPARKDELVQVTATPPFEIRTVSVRQLGTMSGPTDGGYSARWQATKGGSAVQVGVDVKCRIDGRNLVTLFSNASPESATFFPDPKGAPIEVCQLRWFEKETKATLAHACFRGGELTDGACSPAMFPAPALPPGMQIDFKVVDTPNRFRKMVPVFELKGRNVRLSALATLGIQLASRPYSIFRCQDGALTGTASEPLAFVELERLGPGETLYAWSWFFTFPEKHALKKLDRCELQFFTSDPTASPAGTQLGSFCIQSAGEVPTTTPGSCTPPIPPAAKKK